MGLIELTQPTNLDAEKAKFFADRSYNPQFKYERPVRSGALVKHGLPRAKFYKHALFMLEEYGVPKYQGEKLISKRKMQGKIDRMLAKLGVDDRLGVVFVDDMASKCVVKDEVILLRWPVKLTPRKFDGLLNHEVQTHLLRRLNHQLQPFARRKKTTEYRRTEEGLAIINGRLNRQRKVLSSTYINYLATYWAQEAGFAEVFERVNGLLNNKRKSWNVCVKVKRGLEDTSKPGGLTKSIVYLEGAAMVWKWIEDGGDPRKLYIGRISTKQVESYEKKAVKSGLLMPTFFDDMSKYKAKVSEIGSANKFERLYE